jgi:hypothetical protein
MFGIPIWLTFRDFQLTEAEVTAQLPAIDRCQRQRPVPDWDLAWQEHVQQTQQEETSR